MIRRYKSKERNCVSCYNWGRTKLLHNVQYVPELTHILLSVGQFLASGYSVTFTEIHAPSEMENLEKNWLVYLK